MDMIIDIIGQEEYNRLRLLSMVTTKFTLDELEEIKAGLREYLARIV